MGDEEEKADLAQRVLRAGEDPSRWLGVQIGQRWYRKGSAVAVFVNDLQLVENRSRVTIMNHVGRHIGHVDLERFVSDYEPR